MTDTDRAGRPGDATAQPSLSGGSEDPTPRHAQKGGVSNAAPEYMSYSRMNSILTCGHQFFLERIVKVPSREHWASVGGNAFHSAVEQILRAELSS